MVDSDGYTKLIDFGTATFLKGRTYTIVGTPHYMAPEVIVGKGYGIAVDYWSLGVILYEFMCGSVPFGNNEKDPYVIYEKILEHKLSYTRFMDSRNAAKPLIEQLLSRNPLMRIGGSLQLKSHPWLAGFSWENLINRQIRAPFRPKFADVTREIHGALFRGESLEEVIVEEEKRGFPDNLSSEEEKESQQLI